MTETVTFVKKCTNRLDCSFKTHTASEKVYLGISNDSYTDAELPFLATAEVFGSGVCLVQQVNVSQCLHHLKLNLRRWDALQRTKLLDFMILFT